MDEDVKLIADLRNEIKQLEWRLEALEKEQRMIREDILSGEALERMKKRLLNNPIDDINETKRRMEKRIDIDF